MEPDETTPKYPLSNQQEEELTKRFTYHPPKDDQPNRYESLRAEAKYFAREIMENTPASREQSLALTHLEEAIFWANASIARNEGKS